jgi:hypothetical protein
MGLTATLDGQSVTSIVGKPYSPQPVEVAV